MSDEEKPTYPYGGSGFHDWQWRQVRQWPEYGGETIPEENFKWWRVLLAASWGIPLAIVVVGILFCACLAMICWIRFKECFERKPK